MRPTCVLLNIRSLPLLRPRHIPRHHPGPLRHPHTRFHLHRTVQRLHRTQIDVPDNHLLFLQ